MINFNLSSAWKYSQYMFKILLLIISSVWGINQTVAADTAEKPYFFYTSVGDNVWVPTHLTTDSPESINELFEWLVKTHGITGVYWRDLGFFINNAYTGKETALSYDWVQWGRHLTLNDNLARAAIRSAKKNKLKIYLHAGLFETGVQPDIGVLYNPYMIEDVIRVNNPEWRSVDRWNEIRTPGAISFCYPEARKAFIARLVKQVNELGYDGVNFYNYVENRGARYPEQFGYEKPIMDLFHQRYPNVNPRETALNEEQRNYLAYCRGTFITQYLKELKAELEKTGKKLSVQLSVENPDRIGTWWNQVPFAVQGDIQANYDQWIKDGIVDNICLRDGALKYQEMLLDQLLQKYGKYDVTFTVKTNNPFLSRWDKYTKKGVTPLFKECYAMAKYVKEPATPEMLFSQNWLEQAQILKDISQANISLDIKYLPQVIKLAGTKESVTVRREAIHALGTLKNKDTIEVLEKCLLDEQPSVRIAAARALAKVNSDSSPARIFAALEKNNYFQFKQACVFGLQHMKGQNQIAYIEKMLNSKHDAQQQVAIQAVRYLFDLCEKDKVLAVLCSMLHNPEVASANKYFAATSLIVSRVKLDEEGKQEMIEAFLQVINDDQAQTTVLFQALKYMPSLKSTMTAEQNVELFKRLCAMFEEYGDKSMRKDKAYGWKVIGNTMLKMYPEQSNLKLSEYLKQKNDKWLAWLAYRILYVRLDHKPKLINEAQAIEMHKFAPEFPGYRFFDYKY